MWGMDRLIRNIGNGLPKLEPLLFPVQRSPVHSIAIVLLLVAIAFAVRQMIGPPELGVPFLTFFPAAAISAVFGGFWAGMLATALGSVTATYFFIPPYSVFSFEFRSETVFGNLVYLLDEIVVCSAIAALHRFPFLRAQRDFLQRHLAVWLPAMEAETKRKLKSPFFMTLAALAKDFVAQDAQQLAVDAFEAVPA